MKKYFGIFWLREDFRLEKNLALTEATRNHEKVSALYLYKKLNYKHNQAQKWWLSKSLSIFKKQLDKLNINLEIIEIDSYTKFFEKFKSKNKYTIYWNKIYEPDYLKFDKKISTVFKKKKIDYKIFKGNILNDINDVKKDNGEPFKVFTPYWRKAEKHFLDKIPSLNKKPSKCKEKFSLFKNNLDEKKILPNKDWYIKFEKVWSPGEASALKVLDNFLKDDIDNYSEGRNFPYEKGTSKLSPFIKHGQLHVETIWEKCALTKKKNKSKYLAEIGWREFNHSLINFFPYMLKNNFSKKFDKFPWEKNNQNLLAWKKGLTGYPIVDAGMRELKSTGWMHNRVRMITASFLVKHLLIDWKEGEKHFRDCLLDYNEANNVCGWQWVAGSGADAAPYFRIFNPILQGEKFDKEGKYVKKWVQELKNVPQKYIHKPWEFKDKNIFNLEKDYVAPIVIHENAREKALNAFKQIKTFPK